MFVVSCEMEPEQHEAALSIKPQSEITIKGICSGATFDVVLNRCVIVNP
jgi:hypothetical protein